MQSPEQSAARPWAAGVSEAEQAIALELYTAGNREFTESRFAQALARYKEAIQHWDHPAIRFNMAVCLINLDQPVEARDNLERSLAYGATPLGADLYGQALTYRKLLDAQLAHVTITCQEPGAEVTLDGKLLFTGPGTADQFLRPGAHQVVATKPGFLTGSKTFIGVAGQLTSHDIELAIKPPPPGTPRWRYWKHLLAGGGGAIVGGAATYFVARNNFAAYDRAIAAQCPAGCDAEMFRQLSDLRARNDRAEVEQVVAFSAISMGGLAVITALIGFVVDRPHVEFAPNRARPAATLIPRGTVVSMSWEF